MTPRPERFHLLLLASEQIQPNLMVALSLWQTDHLASVAVLHTADRTRSAEPARQICNLVQAICLPQHGCPKVLAETHLVDFNPQAVVGKILSLIAERPAGRWVLNATGGLKSMSASLPMLSGHPSVAHVIYREIGVGQWFRFHLTHLADLPPMPNLESVSASGADLDGLKRGSTLDSIPLLRLIEAQFPLGREGLQFSSQSSAFESARRIDLLQWAKAASADGWRWQRFLQAQAVPGAPFKSGSAFEWFVAAGLHALGVRQMVHSLGHNAGTKLQEVDLVALHSDQLVFLDLKLPGAGDDRTAPPGDQIRTAAETARMMGGLGATPVLIRPSWNEQKDADLFLLAVNHRVVVLGRERCAELFSTLAKLLGIHKIPADLLALEEWLVSRHRDGATVLSNFGSVRDSLQVRSREEGSPDTVLASPAASPIVGPGLELAMHGVARDRRCNWLLAELGPLWLLRAWKDKDDCLPASPLAPLGTPVRQSVLGIWVSHHSGHLAAVIEQASSSARYAPPSRAGQPTFTSKPFAARSKQPCGCLVKRSPDPGKKCPQTHPQQDVGKFPDGGSPGGRFAEGQPDLLIASLRSVASCSARGMILAAESTRSADHATRFARPFAPSSVLVAQCADHHRRWLVSLPNDFPRRSPSFDRGPWFRERHRPCANCSGAVGSAGH